MSWLSYAVAVVMLVLMGIQSVLLVGAYKAHGYVEDVEDFIETQAESLRLHGESVSSEKVRDLLGEQFPMLSQYFPALDEYALNCDELMETVEDEIEDYIAARWLWLLGILAVGTVGIYLTMERLTRRISTYYGDDSLSDGTASYDELWDN